MGSKDNNYKKVVMMMIKGKRTKRRQRLPSPPSLTMPSASSAEPQVQAQAQACGPCNTTDNSGSRFNSFGSTSSASPANSVNEFTRISTQVEQDMANCLILLAQADPRQAQQQQLSQPGFYATYQCKTCERFFPSFQALGGHRASHKRPKPSPAAALQHLNNVVPMDHDQQARFDHNSTITSSKLSLQISSTPSSSCSTVINARYKSSKVHECSICGAEFGSGQALGGHMRRHRTILPPIATSPTPAPNHQESNKKPRNILSLDLNLPAPEDQESKFPFAFKEKVIVFSASVLVDCHH